MAEVCRAKARRYEGTCRPHGRRDSDRKAVGEGAGAARQNRDDCLKPTWTTKRLEEVAQLLGGSTPSRENPAYWGGDIPWVTPTDLPMPGEGIRTITSTAQTITQEGLNSSAARLVPPGTVLFSSRATIGKIGIAAVPLATNQGFANLIPREGVDSRFLAYSLWSDVENITKLAGSTTFKEVSRGNLRSFIISVPPLPEQHRIVNLLDEADELRRRRAQADRRTADLIPALFYEMFGDPLGQYQTVPLSKVVREFRYGTSNKSSDAGYPALRIPNVIGNTLDLTDLKCVEVSAEEFCRIRLEDGDILFVRTNGNPDYIGRSAIFEKQLSTVSGLDPSAFIYASYLIRARLDLNQIDPYFLQHHLCSTEGRREVRKRARTSAGQYNINTEGLGTIPVPLPAVRLQRQFAARVAEIRALQARQLESRRRLDDLFQSMLHRAFQGEL